MSFAGVVNNCLLFATVLHRASGRERRNLLARAVGKMRREELYRVEGRGHADSLRVLKILVGARRKPARERRGIIDNEGKYRISSFLSCKPFPAKLNAGSTLL